MNRHGGFSLLEVMVAAVVTALGLAGVVTMLLTANAGTAAAGQETQAALLARQLAALVALAPDAEDTWLAQPPDTAADCALGGPCRPEAFAQYNFRHWRTAVALRLHAGQGWVCRDASPDDGSPAAPRCDGAGPMTVKVFWREPGDRAGTMRRLTGTVAP